MDKKLERRYLTRVEELTIDVSQGQQWIRDEIMRLIEDAFNEGQKKKKNKK